MPELKPLNWKPEPGIGYRVVRRPDGGMTLTFTDFSDATMMHWHDFALEHLLGSDRLTRSKPRCFPAPKTPPRPSGLPTVVTSPSSPTEN